MFMKPVRLCCICSECLIFVLCLFVCILEYNHCVIEMITTAFQDRKKEQQIIIKYVCPQVYISSVCLNNGRRLIIVLFSDFSCINIYILYFYIFSCMVNEIFSQSHLFSLFYLFVLSKKNDL